MVPFLYKIAEVFYRQYGAELYTHTFVFPNRRAGIFFQKYLAEIAGKPVFSPTVMTIQELFALLSPYQPADKIQLLVMLYGHFVKVSHSEESFDEFLYWGEMLLNDFSDVDKHLVDARQLFRNIRDLRSLETDKSYLTDKQIEAIRRFWTNFMPVENNKTKQHFLETWEVLLELYTAFRAELHEKQYAYEGMIFREVAERAKAKETLMPEFTDIVFVGLNALTPAETALLDYLKNTGAADFYWDYDSPMIRDEQNKASLWVKDNLRRFPSRFDVDDREEKPKTTIEVIGIPSGVGQAKQVTRILSDLIRTKEISDPDEAIDTAIILPDENLLLPVLYSIPEEIGKINVTMGYGLSHSSVSSLTEHIADLQRNVRTTNGASGFYYRFVLSILNHPLIGLSAKKEAEALKKHILDNNRIVVPVSELQTCSLFRLIFAPVVRQEQVADYLKDILTEVYNSLTGEKHGENATPNDTRPIDLEREFIVQYYKSVTRLQDTLQGVKELAVDTYFRLLKRLAQGLNVAFSGEPLSGLQIMGVLETRVLDFDNLILLSMNEGVYPLKKPVNSFIPFTLRKGFGLPTYEYQDSIYAYHFYRMISRAKRVYMLYDSRAEEMQTGEVSRYFYQLKYLYNDFFDIRERVMTYDVSAPQVLLVSVAKTPAVMQKLEAFREGGDRYLSASSVNNYINCPLQFYFTTIENLSEETEVQESVESDVFGTIFHKLMEVIYNRYKGKTVTPDILTTLAKDDAYLTRLIEQAFAEYYFKQKENPQSLQGQIYLIGEILRSYVKQTLKTDQQFTPFDYIDSEHRFKRTYRVNDGLLVNFKGSIDRIDRVGDRYRVIDYKSGKGEVNFKDVQQLFDASKANRPYQILQVLLYSYFYLQERGGISLSPAIYYLRSIFGDLSPDVTQNKQLMTDLSLVMEEFLPLLNHCLEEMFDPSIPFSQTRNEMHCRWCPFRDVCGK